MSSLDAFFAWAEKQQNLEHARPLRPRQAYRSPLFSPQRMEVLTALIGNPQHAYRVVHIAGTKGKGSTAHLVTHSFAAHGQRVGCYLSPHIFDYRERFLLLPVNLLTEAQWIMVAEELRTTLCRHCGEIGHPHKHPVLGTTPPTTFEILTLFAFLLFRAAGCQWAVIECGLGGRHDSTNIVSPTATVITSIEREHTRYLGWRLSSIATQKAGIIKKRVPLFIFPQRVRVVTRVLQRRAVALAAPIHAVPATLSALFPQQGAAAQGVGGATSAAETAASAAERLVGTGAAATTERVAAEIPQSRIPRSSAPSEIQTIARAFPPIQQTNIAAAYLVSAHCIAEFVPSRFAAALTAATQLPGRYQQLTDQPAPLYCDGAHTVLSLIGAVQTFTATYGRRGVCIFGCSADKNSRRLLRILRGSFAHYLFIAAAGGSSIAHTMMSPARLVRHAHWLRFPRRSYRAIKEVSEIAVEVKALRLPTLICGSFYIIAPVMQALGLHQNGLPK